MKNFDLQDKKKLSAVCGLFCPSCSLYIGTKEDPKLLMTLVERFQTKVEDLECEGCRSEKRSFYCRNICKMASCAEKKGIEFCGECDQYPCEEIKKFQAERPHRLELWDSLERIKEVGYSTWFDEQMEHYACSQCGVINSAYDRVCRSCGHDPSCDYVERHQETIKAYLKKTT